MSDNKLSILQLIKAVAIFAVTFVLSVLVFAVALYFLEDGYRFSPLFATICLALGCFTVSLYLGNAIGEKGLLIGLLVCACVFAITTLVTLLVNSGAVSVHLLLRFIILLLASFTGAIIGVNKKVNKKFI